MEQRIKATIAFHPTDRRQLVIRYGLGRVWRANLHDIDGHAVSGNLLPPRDSKPKRSNRNPTVQPAVTLHQLLDTLREQARQLGFAGFAVAPAIEMTGYPQLLDWIDSGYAAGMDYFAKRSDAYRHPDSVLEGVRSIIVLTLPYNAGDYSRNIESDEGRIARYVWGHTDYHDVVHPKLKQLCKTITQSGTPAKARGVIDTAPLMEREVAELAGLGWRGKNTLLLNKFAGSYFFLACILTDLDLPNDKPHATSHCGTCTACLDACPTDAFPRPGVLDANRCISYLTIEHRGPIPEQLREGIGDWLFGCDVCQQVCPWNRRPSRAASAPDEPLDRLLLTELFELDDDQFRARFRKTPLWRARRRGVLRNAAIVLGNGLRRESVNLNHDQESSDQESRDRVLTALRRGSQDTDEVIRDACQWAIRQAAASE